jgi:DOPA 4,5-dioxygenase
VIFAVAVDGTRARIVSRIAVSDHGVKAMATTDVGAISGWHAHVYFDASSRERAWAFREVIATSLGDKVTLGRFHERPVGPHPKWSYQLAFDHERFAEVAAWLALNHGTLDVFLHPNTGDQLRDHRDCAVWIGRSHELDLRAVGG